MQLHRIIERSGWMRLAVVLSVIWLGVVSTAIAYEFLSANPADYGSAEIHTIFFTWVRDLLLEPKPGAADAGLRFQFKFTNALLIALLPILTFLMSALAIIPGLGWALKGFDYGTRYKYLIYGRLSDVLALIQVLALDEDSHRSALGLKTEFLRIPSSAESWIELAMDHPEFFRVDPDSNYAVSLLSRHVTPKGETGRKPISSESFGELLRLAVDIHDRQARQASAWQAYIPVLVAFIAGAVTIFGFAVKLK